MTRYYFDLHNGDGQTFDEEGLELSSRELVSKELARIMADVTRDELPAEGRGIVTVKVRNQDGRII